MICAVAARKLTYEEMLQELHGLLGAEVGVEIGVQMGRRYVPLAILYGPLRAGVDTELPIFGGYAPHVAAGETVAFYVGPPGEHFSVFLIRHQDFKLGSRHDSPESRTLEFMTGRVRVRVSMGEDDHAPP